MSTEPGIASYYNNPIPNKYRHRTDFNKVTSRFAATFLMHPVDNLTFRRITTDCFTK